LSGRVSYISSNGLHYTSIEELCKREGRRASGKTEKYTIWKRLSNERTLHTDVQGKIKWE